MIHVFRAHDIKRIRRLCPYHNHLCYGEQHNYYDSAYIFLDCGTSIQSDGWSPPPKKKCHYCRKYFRPEEMLKHRKTFHNIA